MEVIRDATPYDFARINEIYNWTIVDNHISFDTEPWTIESRRVWWEGRDTDLDFLVAELDGYVVGVAYSSRYRPKKAYRSSVETTVVLDIDYLGAGLGTRLLGALVDRLKNRGLRTAIAIVSLPNEASMGLHQKLGYKTAGVIHEAGFKYDKYWDTAVLERPLAQS